MLVVQRYTLKRMSKKNFVNVKLVLDAELQDALDKFTGEAVKSLLQRLREKEPLLPVV